MNDNGQLNELKSLYGVALSAYIRAHPLFWTDKLGIGGSFNNFEVTMTNLVSGGKAGYERGCVACQRETFKVVRDYLADHPSLPWSVSRIMVGNVFEHHAVAVHPKGSDITKGEVWDPWIHQKPEAFSFEDWSSHMWRLKFFGDPRSEEN